MSDKHTNITKENVFADLGLEDSDEMVIRSDLMSEVVRIVRDSGLPQKEIATILGISAPKVSALMTGKINDFSNDTLMHYLTLMGCNLDIIVQPQHSVTRTVLRGSVKVKRRSIVRRRSAKSKA
ncbi:MAG: putative conserved small protein [Parachlamydiales bacterium]|nr:putative conserved small protein [Parachlamydiales bacterium]